MNDKPGWGPQGETPVPSPPSAPAAPSPPMPSQPPYPYGPRPAYGQAPAVQYGPQPGYSSMAGPYGAPPYGAMAMPSPPGKGLQVASLVLGIASLFVFLSWIALICGVLGILLGAVGRSKAKHAGAPTGMGTAGIICGSIGVVLSVGLIVVAIVVLSNNPDYFVVG